MKQAQRVYRRHNYNKNSQSPFFKSNVKRNTLDHIQRQEPGPGTYEVTLPLIKPKYEAIFKNNRSIIIKVNDIPVPAFNSNQARFKSYTTIEAKQKQSGLDLAELQKKMQNKINSKRYNFSLARKRSNESLSLTLMMTNENGGFYKQNSKSKGPEWSKYKQQRQLFQKDHSCFPGPGSYNSQNVVANLFEKNCSWQFRSSTKRAESVSKHKAKNAQVPESIEKVNGIHSRYNLLQNQYY